MSWVCMLLFLNDVEVFSYDCTWHRCLVMTAHGIGMTAHGIGV